MSGPRLGALSNNRLSRGIQQLFELERHYSVVTVGSLCVENRPTQMKVLDIFKVKRIYGQMVTRHFCHTIFSSHAFFVSVNSATLHFRHTTGPQRPYDIL